ncbi:MAG: MarR family transcriptional regulator [Enterocloster asparagiformis]|nr:MarR family transcriptional regulator [Enterocloster asparagiformis]
MAFINFKDQWFQELRKVNWLVRERVEEICRPFGLTPEQGRVLNYLYMAGEPVNLTQLSQALHVTKGNCSMFFRRLEKTGHIAMMKNDRDARFINIGLTESGRALVERMTLQMGDHSEQDTMSPEDLEQILNGLKCLEKYLQS